MADSDVSSQPDPLDVESSDDEEPVQSKRRKKQQGGSSKRCPGGVRRVGCKGGLRSLGKFGEGMVLHCEECGGPHKATLQATDSVLKAYMTEKCQLEGPELEKKLKDFCGELLGLHQAQ